MDLGYPFDLLVQIVCHRWRKLANSLLGRTTHRLTNLGAERGSLS